MIKCIEVLDPGTPFETLQTCRLGVVLGRSNGQAGIRVDLSESQNKELRACEKTVCGAVRVRVLL